MDVGQVVGNNGNNELAQSEPQGGNPPVQRVVQGQSFANFSPAAGGFSRKITEGVVNCVSAVNRVVSVIAVTIGLAKILRTILAIAARFVPAMVVKFITASMAISWVQLVAGAAAVVTAIAIVRMICKVVTVREVVDFASEVRKAGLPIVRMVGLVKILRAMWAMFSIVPATVMKFIMANMASRVLPLTLVAGLVAMAILKMTHKMANQIILSKLLRMLTTVASLIPSQNTFFSYICIG